MNGSLDINTERGREAEQWQREAAEIVFGRSKEFSFVHTETDNAAVVDGFMLKNGMAYGVAEIKSRPDMTVEQLMDQFDAEWILTHQKLLDMQIICRLMRISGWGFIYCIPDRCVMVVPLIDKQGNIICKYRVEKTWTQATINGGQALRDNAYILVIGGKIYNA